MPVHLFREQRIGKRESRTFATHAISGVESLWAQTSQLTAALNFSHHLNQVFTQNLYAAHPQFFPVEGTQRLKPPAGSYFWNPDISRPDVAQYAAGAARQYFDTHPGAVSFSLGINDALIWGESFELLELLKSSGEGVAGGTEDRRGGEAGGRNSIRPESRNSGIPAAGIPNAWFRERPNYSDVVFTFMNRAASELEKTHPDKYLGALAYYWAESAPRFRIHPQVVPFLTADRSQGYDPDFKREEFELQDRWGSVTGWQKAVQSGDAEGLRSGEAEKLRSGDADKSLIARGSSAPQQLSSSKPPRRLGMYDYLYGGGFLIPRIWTRLLDENLKHAHRSGFTDYYAEAYPNEGLDGPMLWLTARLLQDVGQSHEALLDEFYRTRYGEAAEPMRRFFERCETLWMSQPRPAYWLKHYRNESQAVIFPSSECRVLREMLNEANDRVSLDRRGGGSEGRRGGGTLNTQLSTLNAQLRETSTTVFGFEAAGTAATRRNVKLVSDAFGVTERFVAFYEARDVLSRLALRVGEEARIPGGQNSGVGRPPEFRDSGLPATEVLATALTQYLSARDEFVRYTTELRRSSPTAIRTFNFDDYLKNDPTALALLALRARFGGSEGRRLGEADGRAIGGTDSQIARLVARFPSAANLWRALSEPTSPPSGPPTLRPSDSRVSGTELLVNAPMSGPLQPARTIASLPYGVALPAPWQSSVEPSQYHSAEFTGSDDARVLRISGTKDTSVSQWVRVSENQRVGGSEDQKTSGRTSASPPLRLSAPPTVARIQVRGHVSPGTAVTLVFTWLNEQQKYVGFSKMRLPDGEWPEFVTLEQAAQPPPGAAWAGIGLRVQNQVAGDWVEAKGFSLTAENAETLKN